MGESIVQRKTAKLIRQELADILTHELTVVPGVFLTLSQVRVTADLGLARVYVSVLPPDKLETSIQALEEEQTEIRHRLAGRIRNKMRSMPELRFYADDSFEQAERINQLLDESRPKDQHS